MNIRETLISFMKEPAYSGMDINELAKIFGIGKKEIKAFKDTLDSMEKDAQITKTKGEKYVVPENIGLLCGKLECHSKGYGFVVTSEDEPDIFIQSSSMNGAMNGDKVMAKIIKEKEDNRKYEGEIVKIIERANKTIVGVYEDNKNFGFVIPDDKKISKDIFISKSDKHRAVTGDVVLVQIIKWPREEKKAEGKIIEILGKKDDAGVDILSIIKRYNLPEEFPHKVLKCADDMDTQIPQKEYDRRKDLRNIRMVTIDGEDAKDLDDAVSIARLENGNFYLGVHIADVSHYVNEKSPLDKEAFKRGNSVYLIDRVIPMLPRKLSNGICSLNPKEDRLALSCLMEINRQGKVESYDIVESVIKTNERMTYTDVNKILKDNDEELIKKYDYLVDDFKTMEELSKILYKKRIQRGAIDFDFVECKIILDEKGKPIDIKPDEREVANKIIEEFMLVCNETVAEHMYWAKTPFVYRIHENPDEAKLEHFTKFANNLGIKIKQCNEIYPKILQDVIEKVKGKDEEAVISTLLLRSLKQARYSPECVGHFGLAAKYYCHFTSPIRRYPDLIIHRIIKEFINGKLDNKRTNNFINEVERAATQSSMTERIADDAEREVDDLKKAEYMMDKIGNEYEGIISSVTNFGMFVELPNTVEGLVHISTLNDDYYFYDEDQLCLIGERTKKTYKLGTKVKIKVESVDLPLHEVNFICMEQL